jgi:hypothetical protein
MKTWLRNDVSFYHFEEQSDEKYRPLCDETGKFLAPFGHSERQTIYCSVDADLSIVLDKLKYTLNIPTLKLCGL